MLSKTGIIALLALLIVIIILVLKIMKTKSKEGIFGGVLYSYEPPIRIQKTDRFINSRKDISGEYILDFSATFDSSNSTLNNYYYIVSFDIFNNVFVGDVIGSGEKNAIIMNKLLPNPPIIDNYSIVTDNRIDISGNVKNIYIHYMNSSTHTIIKDKLKERRGTGTFLNSKYVLTCAHVVESTNDKGEVTEDFIIAAYEKAITDGSNQIVFTNDKIQVYYNLDTQYLCSQKFMEEDTDGWIATSKIYIPVNRYTPQTDPSGNIIYLTTNDNFDLAILKLESEIRIPEHQQYPNYNIPDNIYQLINTEIVSLEYRGSVYTETNHKQTPIFPFRNYHAGNDAIIDSYIISNGPSNVQMGTCGYLEEENKAYPIAFPTNNVPLVYSRKLTNCDTYPAGLDVDSYKPVKAVNIAFSFFVTFNSSPLDSSSSTVPNVYQYVAIGDVSNSVGVGFIGNNFGLIENVNGQREIIKNINIISSQREYQIIIQYNGVTVTEKKSFFTKTVYYKYNYVIYLIDIGGNPKVIASTDYTSDDFFVPEFYSYIFTQQDSNSRLGRAVPLYTSIPCKKLIRNRGSFLTTPTEPQLVLEKNSNSFLRDAIDTGIISLPEYDPSFNNLIFFTTNCYEPSGSNICKSNSLQTSNFSSLRNGPLPIANPVSGDSGGGVYYYDSSGNQYLIGVGIVATHNTNTYSSSNKFNILLCLYNFISFINNIISS